MLFVNYLRLDEGITSWDLTNRIPRQKITPMVLFPGLNSQIQDEMQENYGFGQFMWKILYQNLDLQGWGTGLSFMFGRNSEPCGNFGTILRQASDHPSGPPYTYQGPKFNRST